MKEEDSFPYFLKLPNMGRRKLSTSNTSKLSNLSRRDRIDRKDVKLDRAISFKVRTKNLTYSNSFELAFVVMWDACRIMRSKIDSLSRRPTADGLRSRRCSIIKAIWSARANVVIVLVQICWSFIVFDLAASLSSPSSSLSFWNSSNINFYHHHEMNVSSLLWKVEIWR